jgi:hypothetical protein
VKLAWLALAPYAYGGSASWHECHRSEGKLDVLRVECTKCSRRGVYHVHRLIEKHGRKGNLMKWKEQLNGDCLKRDAHSMLERCDLVCPDLPKVL